jgi:16S rRNA (guanine527-N7)-methyltransferase
MTEPSASLVEAAATLADRYRLAGDAAERLVALVLALAAEPSPATAIIEPAAALDRHVADSLAALELTQVGRADRIADVGAGIGFPGLALAVALPSAEVDLVESIARRCTTIDRLAAASGAANARSVPARAEVWAAGGGRGRYDVATTRALASLPVVLEYAAPLLSMGGTLVAWRGRRDTREEADGEAAANQLGMAPGEVLAVQPFPEARDRHLHTYEKREPTPARYPRRPGRATKRPLV